VSGAIRHADAAINRRNGRGSNTALEETDERNWQLALPKKVVCTLDDGPANGCHRNRIPPLRLAEWRNTLRYRAIRPCAALIMAAVNAAGLNGRGDFRGAEPGRDDGAVGQPPAQKSFSRKTICVTT
jgi:hypothetical protein